MRLIKLWVLCLGLLFAAGECRATILFAGGEDASFTCNGTCAGGTTSTPYRTAFARIGYGVQNGTTVADPPANRITTPTFTSVSTIWVHAQLYPSIVNTTTSGEQSLILRSPDGVARILLRQTGTAGTLKASTRNAAGTITDLATASSTFTAATLFQIDMKVVYGCTSSDTLTLYYNSSAVISYTGNLCTDSATQLNQLDLAAVSNEANTCGVSSGGTCWSEVIVADEDTRGMALNTFCLPSAAGNSQTWTPNTVGNIAKATISDTTSISTASQPALSQWTCTTSQPSGSWGLKAVALNARLQVGTTGPQTAKFNFRINGTDYDTGSTLSPSTTYGNFQGLFTTSPATGSAWDISGEVYKSGFNIGIDAQP